MSLIQSYSGSLLNITDPKEDEIDINDIAHALSLLCRFGGHCEKFYSVAEHSVRCMWKAPVGFKKEALLHDASEAYLVDIPRPIKIILLDYKKIESRLEEVIASKYNLPFPMSPEVKVVDNTMLSTEKRDLMKGPPWEGFPDPYPEEIKPWSPKKARDMFLTAFESFKE